MSTEHIVIAPEIKAETVYEPKNIKDFEKSWFWIALLSLFNLYYTVSATNVYFGKSTGFGEYGTPAYSIGYVAAAVGICVSMLIKRQGILEDPRKFKKLFITLSGIGIASMVIFAVLCNTLAPDIVWLAIILQYIAMIIPAVTAGCALYRAIKRINVKQAAMQCGLLYIVVSALTLAHSFYIELSGDWRLIEFSFISIYVVLTMIPALLLMGNKDRFESASPKITEYFSESLFLKFMILAAMMSTLDIFYAHSYYGGGTSGVIQKAVLLLPIITEVFIILLLRKSKWLPVMLACTLTMCFQQGLILFFNNEEPLAAAYALFDVISNPGPVIFMLFIPMVFSLQSRKSMTAISVTLSFWLCGNAIISFFSDIPALAAPAISFTLSIAAIALLFYLHSEYNRVYYNTLINDIRDQLSKETLASGEAMAEAGFTEDERKVTLLLIEGETRYGISRKLHRPVAEISRDMDSIREKVIKKSDPDPGIAAAVRSFELTRRETDTLRCLCRNMTNADIAAELIISEETVKKHVRSLMKKLPVDDRKDVAAWVESLADTTQ